VDPIKLTTAQWIQLLVVVSGIVAAWTTVKVSLADTQSQITSLQYQISQVQQEYVRHDVLDAQLKDLQDRLHDVEGDSQ
jgi:hypothetical protein